MTVALITHPDCLAHDPGPFHPESPDRLRHVMAALESEEFAGLIHEAAPLATREQLVRVHTAAHIDALLALDPSGDERIAMDADTLVGPGSVTAARRAAGGAVAAVDAVMDGWARRAFVAVRPPGHHAERDRAMGFCLFSTAAIAARHAQAAHGLSRVAVVDFDVHHGNGSQDAMQDDPGLFYASSHQWPCYPGTGAAQETGVSGNVLNVLLPPGTGGTGFRAAWRDRILPALADWQPELLIVSAGFDAHRDDPLAQLTVEEADFAWLTASLTAIADQHCGGRLVSILEGGYDLGALARSCAAHVRSLLQD